MGFASLFEDIQERKQRNKDSGMGLSVAPPRTIRSAQKRASAAKKEYSDPKQQMISIRRDQLEFYRTEIASLKKKFDEEARVNANHRKALQDKTIHCSNLMKELEESRSLVARLTEVLELSPEDLQCAPVKARAFNGVNAKCDARIQRIEARIAFRGAAKSMNVSRLK